MKDRIAAGFFAGVVAGIAMNIVDWAGYLAGLYEERLLDWAGMITFGRLPVTPFEVAFAQIEQLFLGGLLGTIFAFILLKLTSGNHLLKGWIYGVVANEAFYAVSILFGLKNFSVHTFNATVSHAISSSVYGLTLAYVLALLDRREIGNR